MVIVIVIFEIKFKKNEEDEVEMTSNRKHSLIDTLTIENNFSDNHQSNSEQRWRRSSIAVFPWVRISIHFTF